MAVNASLIQRLHHINRQKADLSGQLRRGPVAVATAHNKLKAAEDHGQSIRSQITQCRMEADSKQLQLREREARIHKWKGMLNTAKENREYQALKEQIAADEKANDVLSDEIFELLESIDEKCIHLSENDRRVDDLKNELEKIEKQVDSKRLVLESELKRVEANLANTEQELSGEFKREYERLVASKGEDAMAELDGRFCSGCSQSITPTLLDKLLMGQAVVCPNCGRLVYGCRD